MKAVEKELLIDQIALNKRCKVKVGGFCMSPIIRNGAEVVIFNRNPEEFVVGNVAAYFVGNNLFIHRIYGNFKDSFRMKADNDTVIVHEIAKSEIFGRVEIVRNPSIYQRLIDKILSVFELIKYRSKNGRNEKT